MQNLDKQKLDDKVASILEDWGMMLVDKMDTVKDNFDNSSPFYLTTIKFKGEKCGNYQALCQGVFAQTLAKNLLGLDDVVEPSQVQDALREMLNVLAGNLLTETYGETRLFELSTPVVEEVSVERAEKFLSTQGFSYLADCEPLVVTFDANSCCGQCGSTKGQA